MNELRLSLVQSDLRWEDGDYNRRHLEDQLSSQNIQTDIIVLPEMFTTGFSMETESLAEKPLGETHQWMQELARRFHCAVTGSYIVEENSHYYNRLLWIEPDGSSRHYNKKHLFRMAEEHDYFEAGNSRTIIEYKGWKILPLICYDLRFPEWSRNTYHRESRTLDYDLLLYVANWPAPRVNAWDTLLQARAIENLAYCAGVNRIGTDGSGKDYLGHSAAYDPKGQSLGYSEKEEILTVKVQKNSLEAYRDSFPAFLDATV